MKCTIVQFIQHHTKRRGFLQVLCIIWYASKLSTNSQVTRETSKEKNICSIPVRLGTLFVDIPATLGARTSTDTHWGRVTHICVRRLTTFGIDNGLSAGRRWAIIWTNTGLLLIRNLKNKFQRNPRRNSCIFIHENAFENVVWEMAAILPRSQCVSWSSCKQVIDVDSCGHCYNPMGR